MPHRAGLILGPSLHCTELNKSQMPGDCSGGGMGGFGIDWYISILQQVGPRVEITHGRNTGAWRLDLKWRSKLVTRALYLDRVLFSLGDKASGVSEVNQVNHHNISICIWNKL